MKNETETRKRSIDSLEEQEKKKILKTLKAPIEEFSKTSNIPGMLNIPEEILNTLRLLKGNFKNLENLFDEMQEGSNEDHLVTPLNEQVSELSLTTTTPDDYGKSQLLLGKDLSE